MRPVLVVDDDPEFRELAGRLLASRGLTVVGQVDRVAAALNAAARLKPAGALVDVELPDGDGRLLTEAGFDVVAQAGDAPDLLRKGLAHRPSVVVADVKMPPGKAA